MLMCSTSDFVEDNINPAIRVVPSRLNVDSAHSQSTAISLHTLSSSVDRTIPYSREEYVLRFMHITPADFSSASCTASSDASRSNNNDTVGGDDPALDSDSVPTSR